MKSWWIGMVGIALLVLAPAARANNAEYAALERVKRTDNLIKNGTFHDSDDIRQGGYHHGGGAYSKAISAGSGAVHGWTISGSVDLYEGPNLEFYTIGVSQSGGISQHAATQPGQRYMLAFIVTSNRDPPPERTLHVQAGPISQDCSADGNKDPEMGYLLSFVATSSDTLVTFTNPKSGGHPPFLNAVSLTPYDEQRESSDKELRNLYLNLADAMKKGVESLSVWISPDFTYTGADGKTTDREAFIKRSTEAASPGDFRVLSYSFEDNLLIAQVQHLEKRTDGGHRVEIYTNLEDRWRVNPDHHYLLLSTTEKSATTFIDGKRQ